MNSMESDVQGLSGSLPRRFRSSSDACFADALWYWLSAAFDGDGVYAVTLGTRKQPSMLALVSLADRVPARHPSGS